MTLPVFGRGKDPGPDFMAMLRGMGQVGGIPAAGDDRGVRTARLPEAGTAAGVDALTGDALHGTTCVAVRYADGVLLAGDRRATSGGLISSHRIEKVFAADEHTGIAIAGVAGPAIEMVRLFRLQLEHYEKVEGTPISLEGKANQLSQMVRANLPAAMRGLAVIPILAGFDFAAGVGRIFEYDITGGRYEERGHAASGSGSIHAGTVLKLGQRPSQSKWKALDLTLEALLVAADSDAGTGGPDPLRDVFPVVASIDAGGYQRIRDRELRTRTNRLMRRLRNRRGLDTGSAKGKRGKGKQKRKTSPAAKVAAGGQPGSTAPSESKSRGAGESSGGGAGS